MNTIKVTGLMPFGWSYILLYTFSQKPDPETVP